MNFNIYRIELITAALTLLTKGIYVFSYLFWHDDLYLKRRGGMVLDRTLVLIFSFVFIYKNEKVSRFFKHRILSQLLCQSSDDINKSSAANTNVYAIYNPNDYLNLNFDKTEEEFVIQHHDDKQLGPDEFSSVIFVKEHSGSEN